jgi:predicted short-subunit dehydrogenase-like oxidoreductase (DUF2520 family)
MIQYNISFAGAGRVAGALCREMYHSGYRIDLIVSESENNGRSLSDSCKASWSTSLQFPDSTDIIIVSVPDHRLENVLNKIRCRPETLVAHTAGSIGIDIFPEHIKRKGILYPLQTFSKERKVDFKNLPFLLESSDIKSSEILENIAESLGGKVCLIDFEHRKMLHLAAVFVCNFTNHLITQGKDVVLKSGCSFDLLSPIIKETFLKAIENGPENSQTGPASRNDQNTIEKHLELLSFSPDLQRIYREMTVSIINYYKKS